MKIKCGSCEKEETYPSRNSAVKDGWKWEEWTGPRGNLYRIASCNDCFSEELLETLVLDFKQQAEDGEIGENLPGIMVENAGRSKGRKPGTIDAAGGKSKTLDQF